MGWQTLGGLTAIPTFPHDTGAVGAGGLVYTTTQLVIDAASEKVAFVLQSSQAGTINRVCFRTATVTTGATVDVRVETVDTATGDPSGTLWAANTNSSVVIADTDDNLWINADLTANATFAQGDIFAIVIVNPGVSFGNMQIAGINAIGTSFPYSDLFTAAWAKSLVAPVCAARLTSGSFLPLAAAIPASAINTIAINSGSTPDEVGNKLTIPVGVRCLGAWIYFNAIANNRDFDVVLYDTDGTTALATYSGDSNIVGAVAAMRMHQFLFPSSVALKGGSTYRVTVVPTSASNCNSQSFTVDSAGILDAYTGGQNIHRTERTNAGAWTDTTTQRVMLGLLIDAIDDGFAGRQVQQVGRGAFPIY